MINKIFIFLIVVVVVLGVVRVVQPPVPQEDSNTPSTPMNPRSVSGEVSSFAECVSAGNPVMESYPRQCRHEGELFVEEVGNELEKMDLIRLETPRPNDVVESPLTIRGEARGTWYFEATFPIVLTNWDGLIIAEGYATAQGDWMTEEFVPFEATLTFTPDPEVYSTRGSLILQKSNASGLPEHDDALEIPVFIERRE